jgi:hypothetical protein
VFECPDTGGIVHCDIPMPAKPCAPEVKHTQFAGTYFGLGSDFCAGYDGIAPDLQVPLDNSPRFPQCRGFAREQTVGSPTLRAGSWCEKTAK